MNKPCSICRLHTMSATRPRLGRAVITIICIVHLSKLAKCTRLVLRDVSMSKPPIVCCLHTMEATCPRLGRAAVIIITAICYIYVHLSSVRAQISLSRSRSRFDRVPDVAH